MTGFTKFVHFVYCAVCKVEMPGSDWPSHYRTRAHRLLAQRTGKP